MNNASSDNLSTVLNRLTITAGVFYSGNLCGLSVFDEQEAQLGHLHVLRSGEINLHLPNKTKCHISQPSLVFIAKPLLHKFETPKESSADLVCASVGYGMSTLNPITSSLPDYLIIPLEQANNIANISNWLFGEAFGGSSGREIVMDRLCELLVIEIFRYLLANKMINQGLFSGLSHPRLSSVLRALHESPEQNWNLEGMASLAAMSRSNFAETFKTTIGQTPADYLTDWRIGIAQKNLKQGQPVALTANLVGYEMNTFTRVFKKKTGLTPTEWLKGKKLLGKMN